jgi:hypothetical protein
MDKVEEYIKEVCEKWSRCPLCGAGVGFEVKRGIFTIGRFICKACSAEWELIATVRGEIKGLKLMKIGLSEIAVQYKFQTHPLEWWAEVRERLRKAEKKGNRCPLCGSEVGIGIKGKDIMFCKACLAEWRSCITKDGEVKGFTLIKPDLAGRATKYVSQTLLLEEWMELDLAGEKVKESKEGLILKVKKVEEFKEELIAKLDKRLINGEISEETYKQILERIKSMKEAEKSEEETIFGIPEGKQVFIKTEPAKLNLEDIDPTLKMMNTGIKLVAGGAVMYIIGLIFFLLFILITLILIFV